VACAARLWAPIRPDERIRDARRGRSLERFRVFLGAYGTDDLDLGLLVPAVQQNQEWFSRLIDRYVAGGHAGFTEYAQSEARMRADDYRAWLAEHERALRAALDL
jgi:hypothetical protein